MSNFSQYDAEQEKKRVERAAEDQRWRDFIQAQKDRMAQEKIASMRAEEAAKTPAERAAEDKAAKIAQKSEAKVAKVKGREAARQDRAAARAKVRSARSDARQRIASARAAAKLARKEGISLQTAQTRLAAQPPKGGGGNSSMPKYGWSGTNQKFGTGR